MINKYTYKKETWVDLNDPTPEEISQIMEEYSVHPLVAKELTSTTPKPRIEFRDGYVYTIIHFPAFKHTHKKNMPDQEIDFILGKNILITARYDTIDPLHKFAKELEVKEITDREEELNGHSIFVSMLKSLYKGIFDELLYMEDTTKQITNRIFEGKEKEMVIKISEITRILLDFKKTTDLHKEILESIIINGKDLLGKEFVKDMESVYLEYSKIHSTIISNLEILQQLRETNDSLLSSKQNEIMKQLTIMGFIILPLTVIGQVFGMSMSNIPFANNPNGFWMAITIMLLSVVIAIIYAKNKKWM